MRGRRRVLAVATALHVIGAVGVATAQTVVVTKVAPGSAVELTLNAARIASATADASGIASLDVNLPAHGGKNQTDVRLAVETCGELFRVTLTEAGYQPPPPDAACARTDIAGLYVMRRVSTFVIDNGGSTPAAWLAQGPAPKTWLHPELLGDTENGRVWGPMPTGLIVSAGGGLAGFADALGVLCGDATCSGRGVRGNLQAAASYWFTRSLALEAGFLKPADLTVTGSGTNFQFNGTLQTSMVTLAAKAGIAAGPARVYGLGGGAYHRATMTTSQTINNSTVSVNGVTTTLPGGTQTFGVIAPAWGWFAGGGVEFWVKRPFAVYVEGIYAPIKGANTGGGEARVDDRIIHAVAGVRVHAWR